MVCDADFYLTVLLQSARCQLAAIVLQDCVSCYYNCENVFIHDYFGSPCAMYSRSYIE